MAIIIPSKNIYGQIDNPKVIDNLVDNVTVNQTVIKPDNQYDTSVYNGSLYFSEPDIITTNNCKVNVGFSADTARNVYAGLYYELALFYKNIDIKIPKILNNKYISKIHNEDGEETEANRKISYSVFGDFYETEIISGTIRPKTSHNTSDAYDGVTTVENIQYGEKTLTERDALLDFPEVPTEVTYSTYEQTGGILALAIIDVDITNETHLTLEDDQENDNYIISGQVLCGMQISKATGYEDIIGKPPSGIDLRGTVKLYEGKEIQVTAYGNTIGISLEDGTILYGSGNKPHSLSGNELMQDSAKSDGVLTTKWLADNVLLQYENGKETATIMCGIADYYNQNTFVKATQVSNYFQLSEYGSRNAVSVTDQNTHIALAETDNSLKATQENGVLRLKYSGVDKAISVTDSYENLFDDLQVLYPSGVVQNDNSFYIKTYYDTPIVSAVTNLSYDEKTKRHYINISKSSTNYIVNVELDVVEFGFNEHNYFIGVDLFILPDGNYNVSCIYDVENNTFHFRDFIVCEGLEVPRNYPMAFNISDTVVPMIRSPYGADIPLSDNTDGSPKMFSVASRNITYDGAILQKLSIQEKTIVQ